MRFRPPTSLRAAKPMILGHAIGMPWQHPDIAAPLPHPSGGGEERRRCLVRQRVRNCVRQLLVCRLFNEHGYRHLGLQ